MTDSLCLRRSTRRLENAHRRTRTGQGLFALAWRRARTRIMESGRLLRSVIPGSFSSRGGKLSHHRRGCMLHGTGAIFDYFGKTRPKASTWECVTMKGGRMLVKIARSIQGQKLSSHCWPPAPLMNVRTFIHRSPLDRLHCSPSQAGQGLCNFWAYL